ncbi:MAG: diamine N-acetyltransferase [Gemmatimonadaceae bacterium]|jgi:ribosomal protein S18 acetylase RimI-like enzyme|nr:diamine N-acetyltransferase [Gemmatimonadaceae bacterium]
MPSTEIDAYTVRRCTRDDAETIASLGARLFVQAYGPTHPEPERSRYLAKAYSVDVIAEAIVGEGSSIFAVEGTDNVPIAYAHMIATTEFPPGVNGRRAFEIVRFYVDGAHQGRGIGAMLMNHCCATAREAGADVIWLQTWSQASWAIGFYLRLGFRIAGRKPFYFGERIDEDHVMALTL